jgi:hypothetical protein
MTLGGMAIAIGALVDDAIIDVENVVRRCVRTPETADQATSGLQIVVRDATLEIRTSIVFRHRSSSCSSSCRSSASPASRGAADAAGVRVYRGTARIARGRGRS